MKISLFSSFEQPAPAGLPAPGDLHVWLLPIYNHGFESTDFKYLSPGEQAAASRFSRPDDRQRYLAAHAALRRILSSYLACPARDLAFSSNEYGKPFLSYPHDHRRPLHFSLSHSGEYTALAFSLSSPVGIDIERSRSSVKPLEISKRFYHPKEAGQIACLPPSEQKTAFFRLWTLREAFLKGLGTGFHTRPDSFCICPDPHSDAFCIEKGPADYSPWKLVPISAPEGYFCSLAYQES